jgi:hypothetical protein
MKQFAQEADPAVSLIVYFPLLRRHTLLMPFGVGFVGHLV